MPTLEISAKARKALQGESWRANNGNKLRFRLRKSMLEQQFITEMTKFTKLRQIGRSLNERRGATKNCADLILDRDHQLPPYATIVMIIINLIERAVSSVLDFSNRKKTPRNTYV